MKKFLILLMLFPSICFSQISVEDGYEGVVPPKNPDAPQRMHRWFLDLGYSSWYEFPDIIVLKPYSIGFNAARFIEQPLNKKSNVALAIGVSISTQNVHSNCFPVTSIDSLGVKYTAMSPINPGITYRRNKLSLNYIEVPVELRLRTNKKNNFFMYAGFKGGYLFNNHTTYADSSGKYKTYNTYGFSRFEYGPTFRLGVNRLSLYFYYAMTSIYQERKGDRIMPFMAGLSINAF